MNEATACRAEPGCITCGDVAVALTVLDVQDADARCRDAQGREELVAVELVGALVAGDRVLVHAGVALERPAPTPVPTPTRAPVRASTAGGTR